MAKKSIDDNLLTGGSLGNGESKSKKNSKSKTKKGVSKNTAKVIKAVICVLIVIALVAGYFFSGIARKGIISNLGIPAKTLTVMTVSNGEQKEKVKLGTYNFYFFTVYNNLYSQISQLQSYGIDPAEYLGTDVDITKTLASQTYVDEETGEEMTWDKHLQDQTFETIEDTYTFYMAAVAANNGEEPALSEEHQKELDSTIEEYRKSAYENDFELTPYLTRVMGKGVTESVVREELKRQYIADDYKNSLTKDTENVEYTSDQITAYKDEHIDDFKAVDFMHFECDNEDDAIAFKNELKADGSNFADLAVKYSKTDFYKQAYADPGFATMLGMTTKSLENTDYAFAKGEEKDGTHVHEGLDWLFSSDRKAGDIYQLSTSVIYLLAPASVQDRTFVDVRHILIQPELDNPESKDYTTATPEQWDAAYDKAESILNEWKSGEATEDSFAELAKANSADSSAENGGLIDNVAPDGAYVNSFAAWSFDPDRKPGDTAIVQSVFGYHVMYFVADSGEKVWETNAKTALTESDATSEVDAISEEYTADINWFAAKFYCQKDVDISR